MKTVALVLLSAFMILVKLQAGQAISIRPTPTYSIVAIDKTTGEMGAAVQSHWFNVGALVPWPVPELRRLIKLNKAYNHPDFFSSGTRIGQAGR